MNQTSIYIFCSKFSTKQNPWSLAKGLWIATYTYTDSWMKDDVQITVQNTSKELVQTYQKQVTIHL
jgi:hypothetical protein